LAIVKILVKEKEIEKVEAESTEIAQAADSTYEMRR